jgi:hypothetical protein
MEPVDDLLTGVLTVASIVVFAKFVTHRTRATSPDRALLMQLALHVTCVLCSGAALTLALLGLMQPGQPSKSVAVAAMSLVGVAVLILVGEGLYDDIAGRARGLVASRREDRTA